MRHAWLALPLLSGCFGVYAEVASTTLPSATIDGSTATGASSVGFNLGAEFGSARMRFALGYASDSTSFDGGSAKLGASSNRFDFNVFSVTDRARIRLGFGFAKGSGTSNAGGMNEASSDGGSAFAGVDLTYFLTWKLALHAFAGPAVVSQSIPGGNVSGTGATFRITASYTFGDVRPDSTIYIPLEENRDLTGLLESGARSMGCTSRRDSNPSSGYAFLSVTCSGRSVLYMQISSGIAAQCESMFKRECESFTLRLTDATKATMTRSTSPASAAPPPPEATPASAPPPAPAPEPAAEPAPEPAPAAPGT
jgi:hypothetical protein